MARIYVKPQVRSSRPPHGRPRALDYNVIEQIANGIEKMVVQWNHAKESRIIRPYTSSRSGSSSRRPSWKLDQAVSPLQVGGGSSSAAAAAGAGDDSNSHTGEMGSVAGGSGEVVIPKLGAETGKEGLDLDGIVSSSWYLKGAHVSSNVEGLDGFGSFPSSSRADRDNAQASEDGSSAFGITPRLESAVERIQVLNNSSSSSYPPELLPRPMTAPAADAEPDPVRKPVQAAEPEQGFYELENEAGKGVVEMPESSSERAESACKVSYVDDRGSPQVLNNQVDDWKESATIVGDENIRELISYTKKKEATQEKEALLDDYKVKIEELQIALLECSTEYEVKIVEMKMMMLNMKSQYRQQMTTGDAHAHINVKLLQPPVTKEFSLVTNNQAKQSVGFLKKQMHKLKQDKENLSRELFTMKKKQRQSEKQKKSLDDALNKVSSLRRELAKRDEEILDSHLREKEQRAQLHELHHALQSARAAQAEPGKLLSLLPVLRNWLKSVQKGQYYCEPNSLEPLVQSQTLARKTPVKLPLASTGDYAKENRQGPRVEKIVGSVTKEIQALQKALEKLACGRYQ